MFLSPVNKRLCLALTLAATIGNSSQTYAADAPLRDQVRTAVEPLLIAGRSSVIASVDSIKKVESSFQKLTAVGDRVAKDQRAANDKFNKATSDLSLASTTLAGAQLKAISTSAAVALHNSLRDQAATFKDQALNTSSPLYVGGDPASALRPAMRRVIRSEEGYLSLYESVSDNTTTWLDEIRTELSDLARGSNARVRTFGFDHYITLLLQRVDAQEVASKGVLPLLTGFDENGQSVRLPRPCAAPNEAAYRPFSSEIDILVSEAQNPATKYSSTNPEEPTWSMTITEAVAFYNAPPSNGKTGSIARWQSCIDSKTNSITALSTSIDRELQRGNVTLARTLDLQRAQVSAEVVALKGELAVIQHRASQIQNFSDAVLPQVGATNLAAYPNAWRKTVEAQGRNLKTMAGVLPKLSLASSALLKQVEDELSTLVGLEDENEIRKQAGIIAERLGAIRTKGFDTYLSHIASGRESFAIITGGNDSSSLTDALTTYTSSTQAKATFWVGEPDRNKNEIALAQTEFDRARGAFDTAQTQLTSLANKLAVFNAEANTIDSLHKIYNTKLARDRFASVYAGLLNELLTRAKSNPAVAGKQAVFQGHLKSVAYSFRGLENVAASKAVRIKDKGAIALKKQQESMKSGAANLIASVTKGIAGISLTDLASKMKGAADRISAL